MANESNHFKKVTLPQLLLLGAACGFCVLIGFGLLFLLPSPLWAKYSLSGLLILSAFLQFYSIREFRKNSRKLELQSNVFELLLNSMSSGVVGLSSRGNLLFSNVQSMSVGGEYSKDAPHEWAKNFGIFEEDQKTPIETENLPAFRSLRGEEIQHYVVFVRNEKYPDGAFLNITSNPIKAANGEILGAVSVFDDITERRANEKRIAEQELMMQHSARLSALGNMAGGIAHEVSTPLAAISLLSENLCEGDQPIDKQMVQTMGAKIRDSVDKIAKLINGLRQFSRDHTKENFEYVPLQRIFDNALSFCGKRLENHAVKISFDYVKDKAIYTKPNQLTEVFLSLIYNSYEAVILGEKRWIKINSSYDESWFTFTVKDSGKKIDTLVAKKMFDPFYSTKKIGHGFGLGLSISRRAIEELGGSLTFDPTATETTFMIRLPVHEEFAITREAATQA